LPNCGGWILKRKIPGTKYQDAMGCYPLFACIDWAKLYLDLNAMGKELISFAMVSDPFGNYNTTLLKENFGDVVIFFKNHYVIDLKIPLNKIICRHHRYYARKSLKNVDIEVCKDPIRFIEDWTALYNRLIKRHKIKGIRAFSYSAFVKQLIVPGTIMFRAVHDNVTIGAQIWYVQNDVGYCHLTALNDVAYKLRASYGLYWTAAKYFIGTLRWLDLGAGAGVQNNRYDGLSMFKKGWVDSIQPAYFCGRIFNQKIYDEIVRAKNIEPQNYFPAYRIGEYT
jgi:hypothetical protein